MANIKGVINVNVGKADGSALLVTWTSLITSALVGDAFELPEWADNCVQMVANTAGGATCVFEGSNDGAVWGTLFNAQGSALSSAASLAPKQVVERPRFVRPKISGGGGTEDWTVTLLCRRAQPMRI